MNYSTAEGENATPPVPEVQYDELEKATKTKKYLLLDVRNPDEYAKGCIPSARLLPLTEIEAALKMSDAQFEAQYGFKKPTPDQEIIVYCRAGSRSTAAANLLQHNAFKNVLNYRGSWNEWSEKHPEDCRG